MDRRVEKTKHSIINAFLELRSKKDIEKIRVKELCEKAGINKSTFYTHYQDIYDLSAQIETQAASDVLNRIGHPEAILSDPELFTKELYYAYLSHTNLIQILFSGSRQNMLVVRIEESLKEMVYRIRPELRENPVVDTLLTLEIYGEYYAFMKCRHFGDDAVIRILCAHWKETVKLLQSPEYEYVGMRIDGT